jgi:hypothetical protein
VSIGISSITAPLAEATVNVGPGITVSGVLPIIFNTGTRLTLGTIFDIAPDAPHGLSSVSVSNCIVTSNTLLFDVVTPPSGALQAQSSVGRGTRRDRGRFGAADGVGQALEERVDSGYPGINVAPDAALHRPAESPRGCAQLGSTRASGVVRQSTGASSSVLLDHDHCRAMVVALLNAHGLACGPPSVSLPG